MADWDENGIQRRVAGAHDFRLDGVADILARARGTSVLDLGCNRGMVCVEFKNYGASVLHGCDIWEPGIKVAREIFADMRQVESKFEVADLTKGDEALNPFLPRYDIVVMLATYHKIKREMDDHKLTQLVKNIGTRTGQYFVWRGPSDAKEANEEKSRLDRELADVGLGRVHTSTLSKTIGMAAIWERK